jgi:hypothetical protein
MSSACAYQSGKGHGIIRKFVVCSWCQDVDQMITGIAEAQADNRLT